MFFCGNFEVLSQIKIYVNMTTNILQPNGTFMDICEKFILIAFDKIYRITYNMFLSFAEFWKYYGDNLRFLLIKTYLSIGAV